MNVDDAILSRRSIRAFTSRPVSKDIVRDLLELSSRAPSGSNMQPWKVWIMTGPVRERLIAAVKSRSKERVLSPQYDYYPKPMPEPYLSRRRDVGWKLYGSLGIAKGDYERTNSALERNFEFFGAPVGIIFTMDAHLKIGSWIDYGMFLQNICLAARARGLHTCVQAAWANVHEIVREIVPIPADHVVICGMAIGFEDEAAPANRLRSNRAAPDDWLIELDA